MPFLILSIFDSHSILSGSAFCISNETGLTAHHCLKPETFSPTEGPPPHRVWLVARKGSPLLVTADECEFYPDLDLTVVRKSWPKYATRYNLGKQAHAGEEVVMLGYPSQHHGKLDLRVYPDWSLAHCEAKAAYAAVKGRVVDLRPRSGQFDEHFFPRPTSVVDIEPVESLASGAPHFVEKGLSGGPVVRYQTRDVVGVMHQRSENEQVAHAIDVDEVRSVL